MNYKDKQNKPEGSPREEVECEYLLADGILECDDCGKRNHSVSETLCPYALDIDNSVEECKLCEECYKNRELEI